MKIFHDRAEAGKELAKKLEMYKEMRDVVVIGLPRGGVVVAIEMARALHVPMDIIVPRKISAEYDEEYAIGAVTESGEAIWNEAERAGSRPEYLTEAVGREHAEALRRLKVYRGNRADRNLQGKIVLLVDDGIATGLTMKAAIQTAKKERAKKIVVAVPHGAADTLNEIEKEVDEVIALERPEPYFAVAEFYESFPQTTDKEVVDLMNEKTTP